MPIPEGRRNFAKPRHNIDPAPIVRKWQVLPDLSQGLLPATPVSILASLTYRLIVLDEELPPPPPLSSPPSPPLLLLLHRLLLPLLLLPPLLHLPLPNFICPPFGAARQVRGAGRGSGESSNGRGNGGGGAEGEGEGEVVLSDTLADYTWSML